MQDTVNDIVFGFGERQPNAPRPRWHPLLTVIGEEFMHMEDGGRKILNFDAISKAVWHKRAKEVKDAESQWPPELTSVHLTWQIRRQKCTLWWLPGVQDPHEESSDDEMGDDSGAYYMCLICSINC